MSEILESERKLLGEANFLNGDMTFRFYQCQVGPQSKQVVIESSWPLKQTEEETQELLFKELGSTLKESPDRDLLGFIGPFGNVFARFSPHNNSLATQLGYQYSEELGNTGDFKTKSIIFRYPTVARLNEIMEAVFRERDSIRFVEYNGGSFPAFDFLKTLAHGEIMVATEQPQEYHDHAALHILGWIGLGGRFKDYFMQTVTPLLIRAEEESKLPRVPGMDYLGVSRFLNPCSEVLRRVVSNLDRLSNSVATIFLGERDLYSLQTELTGSFMLGDPFHQIPSQLLRIPSGEEGFLIANDIESRYLRLAEHAPLFNS